MAFWQAFPSQHFKGVEHLVRLVLGAYLQCADWITSFSAAHCLDQLNPMSASGWIEPIAVSQERFRGGQLGAAPPQGSNEPNLTDVASAR